ncbi:Gfo/Idh/MocA family oxidoreductase [Aliiglaciecola sp. CAU 1673]|uniref:Gfo/Idh/MocA family protein n=1 Tax=Aliiglaciecola sp. CAU 1673 TaxID=3032595 RepID=UPI0023DB90DE|nr:Gfo/Idh/MocA family oxidoreductase [Aliiglaciecola sp. CAU 1673]MDF2180173.1 Gfo/Idh/MocA family oxidoreductase [Aliiglaciecola sp. CAU 1673]
MTYPQTHARHPVNWGILGTGRIASTFARDIGFVENSRLLAVASRETEKAEDFADEYGIEQALTGYNSLLNQANIDAVYVATPHNMHYDNVKAALLANKHVLCEKPMTISPEQTAELVALAMEKQRFLMEGMWTFFLPAIEKAKEWIDRGLIGPIQSIKAEMGFAIPFDANSRLYSPALAGGCLLDIGIYPLALNLLFNNGAPLAMDVVAGHAPNGVEDDLSMVLHYKDKEVQLAASFEHRLSNQAVIEGERGRVVIPNFWKAEQSTLYREDAPVEHFVDDRAGSGLEFEIGAAAKAILAGQLESPVMPWHNSLTLAKQMASIQEKIT